MCYYIYILYSESFGKYYVGYTSNYIKRLEEHNTSIQNTFTSKYRPWIFVSVFSVGSSKSEALKIERFIKKQKSKLFLEKLIDENFIPNGRLAQLVRVIYDLD